MDCLTFPHLDYVETPLHLKRTRKECEEKKLSMLKLFYDAK